MTGTQRHPDGGPADDQPNDAPAPARPDEDGPHDVPDDQVIEKTLPSSPPERGRPS